MPPSVSKLFDALSPEVHALVEAAEAAAEGGSLDLWVVGGAVRDLAAGLRVRDVDLAVSGDPAPLALRIATEVGVEAVAEPRFGTASVRLGGHRLDFAALRTERYARPGALPTVRLNASLEEDLARRDFTVNAFALGLTRAVRDEVIDPFGGLADLHERRLRVLHDRSFIDDATRLWRGARYAARLRLKPDAMTARLIGEGVRWLASISARRLWAEFERTAAEERVAAVLACLDRWGVLTALHAEFGLDPRAARALQRRRGPVGTPLLLAVLLAPSDSRVQAAVEARLGAPRQAVRAVGDASRLLATSDAGPDVLEGLSTTNQAGRTAALWLDPARQRSYQEALARWERTASPLDARRLQQLGVEAGPALGRTLHRLRREWYLGTLSDAAEAERRVREWAAENSRGA